MENSRRKIELLAPARDYECGAAALACGADALYAGAPRFGARAGAAMTLGDIGRLCEAAHRFGAKVYVTMNTLVYERELADAQRIAREVWNEGADALIVQDMAFLRMDLPPIELHASTQTFNTDPVRAEFLARVGFSRIILERALSLEEIARIASACDAEIEAFVHGAVCVSYSGRCYMSRTMGPRSGNRGVCSQPCRLPYDLLDEGMRPVGRGRHLLSLRDMNLSSALEDMIGAGVGSFKIEGRLKDTNYVRNVVGWYRRCLDGILERRDDLERASQGVSVLGFEPDPLKSFSRGATSYYIQGLKRGVASFDTPKSLGEPAGRVRSVGKDWFELEKPFSFSAGDGICCLGGDGALCGTHVNRAEGKRVYPNRMSGFAPGGRVYRNYDRVFVSAVERSKQERTLSVTVEAEITARRIALRFSDGVTEVSGEREGVFDPAADPRKAEDTVRGQIKKTGGTGYRVEKVRIVWDGPRFVPVGVLNGLRREVLQHLDEERLRVYRRRERLPEDREAVYPSSRLGGEENVTNSLSERFYREHGVGAVEPGYDLAEDLTGRRVMQMRYCLRRELGQCLKENPSLRGRLFLRHGPHLYELRFDCVRCGMDVLYRGKQDKTTNK